MKIVYQKLGLEMELNENQVQLLVIENEKIFADITEQFLKFENNEETELVISEKDKLLQFHKIGQVVINPFGLSVNERKIIQKLYSEIESYVQEDWIAETAELHGKIVAYIETIIQKIPYNITFDLEENFQGLMKNYGVRLEEDEGTLVEKLINYVKVIHSLAGIRIVVFIGLQLYLSREELVLFYEFCAYEKVFLIMIENVLKNKINSEKVCIIDQDCCIIEVK